MSDREVIILLNKSKEDGISFIYDRYSIKLLRFINSYIKDYTLAQDILQETFIAIWNTRKNITTDTKIDKLLFTISKNKSLNALRSLNNRNKHTVTESKLGVDMNYMAISYIETNSLEDHDIENQVNRLYQSLPEIYRTTFSLSRIDGLTYNEIALKLDISTKTVEKRISKALSSFRNHINKLYIYLPILLECYLF